jgi:hypothetical protein
MPNINGFSPDSRARYYAVADIGSALWSAGDEVELVAFGVDKADPSVVVLIQ